MILVPMCTQWNESRRKTTTCDRNAHKEVWSAAHKGVIVNYFEAEAIFVSLCLLLVSTPFDGHVSSSDNTHP